MQTNAEPRVKFQIFIKESSAKNFILKVLHKFRGVMSNEHPLLHSFAISLNTLEYLFESIPNFVDFFVP